MLSSFLSLKLEALITINASIVGFFILFYLFRLSWDFGFTKLHILLLLICIFVLSVYSFLFDIRVVNDDKGKKSKKFWSIFTKLMYIASNAEFFFLQIVLDWKERMKEFKG